MTDAVPIHDAAELTRYIERRYHQHLREQLPLLTEMAEKVEAVHKENQEVPDGLSAILRRFIGEMEVHMKKEELILFPAIRKGGGSGIEKPIAVMRADHDDHDREIAEIRRLTRNVTVPHGACRTWEALYAGLAELIYDLTEHIRLENEVLFPQFEPGARTDA